MMTLIYNNVLNPDRQSQEMGERIEQVNPSFFFLIYAVENM